MPPNGALIGPVEACKMLGISRSTLHRWVLLGKVRCFELGPFKTSRFDREDILALLRERQAGAPSEPSTGEANESQ